MRLHDLSVLQSIIIFNAKSLSKNLLFDCFIGLSTNSYLRFLYILLRQFVTADKFLWPNFSSIFFSFSHNVLTLPTITSVPLFSSVFLVISISLYIQKKKINFYYLQKVINNFTYTKKIIFHYLHKVFNNFECFFLIKITHLFFNGIAFKLDLIDLH